LGNGRQQRGQQSGIQVESVQVEQVAHDRGVGMIPIIASGGHQYWQLALRWLSCCWNLYRLTGERLVGFWLMMVVVSLCNDLPVRLAQFAFVTPRCKATAENQRLLVISYNQRASF
jgi:hypothetical protein